MFEKISGQCENCGHEYVMMADLKKPVTCLNCWNETQNWDTVNGSQMAPFLVEVIMK